MRQPSISFDLTPPAETVDGVVIAPDADLTYRLYEDGELVLDNIADLRFELLMKDRPSGQKTYNATSVLHGLESDPSAPLVVHFEAPCAPELCLSRPSLPRRVLAWVRNAVRKIVGRFR